MQRVFARHCAEIFRHRCRRNRGPHRRRSGHRPVRAPAGGGANRIRNACPRARENCEARTGSYASRLHPSSSVTASGHWLRVGGSHFSLTTLSSRTSTPTLVRVPAPESPEPLLSFWKVSTTAEVALLLAEGPDPIPDIDMAMGSLLLLEATGAAERSPIGHDFICGEAAHRCVLARHEERPPAVERSGARLRLSLSLRSASYAFERDAGRRQNGIHRATRGSAAGQARREAAAPARTG